MSKEGKKAEEKIKQKIISGHRRGVCDKDGNSVLGQHGNMVPPSSKIAGGKTYVYRNGKMVEKKKLDTIESIGL